MKNWSRDDSEREREGSKIKYETCKPSNLFFLFFKEDRLRLMEAPQQPHCKTSEYQKASSHRPWSQS